MTARCSTPACTSFRRAELVARTIGALAITLSLAQTATGQDIPPPQLSSGERAKVAGRALSSVVDPGRTTVASPQPIFTLEATTAGAEGVAVIGWQFGDLTFDARVSGPINKRTGEAQFADLDGLRGRSRVDAGLQFLRWEVGDPFATLLPACTKLAELERVSVKKVDCSLSNLRAQESKFGVPLVPYIDPGTVLLFGARYEVSRSDFDYVDPSDLSEGSESHTEWSFAVGSSLITRQNLLLGGGYRREVRFVPGSGEVDLCLPLGVDGATFCTPAVIGAPIRLQSNQLYAELRKFFGPVAVSPRFTRDFTKDVTGVEVPLYFLRNTEGGFTGGVRVGWRSDRSGLTVVGFVGQVLGLLTVP